MPVVVPPALVALQVRVVVAASPGAVGAHPLIAATGDCASLTAQLTRDRASVPEVGAVGRGGRDASGVTTGGVGSNAIAERAIGEHEATPQSRSGSPGVTVQSSAFAGSVMIASSASTVIAGCAERISAAMPAAAGAAALVPKNEPKPGTEVATPSGAASFGFGAHLGRTEHVAGGVEAVCVTGPRALKLSGAVGVE